MLKSARLGFGLVVKLVCVFLLQC